MLSLILTVFVFPSLHHKLASIIPKVLASSRRSLGNTIIFLLRSLTSQHAHPHPLLTLSLSTVGSEFTTQVHTHKVLYGNQNVLLHYCMDEKGVLWMQPHRVI